MADDTVTHNLEHMDELDFAGWNRADWDGVFARHHTDDVLVEVHGQPRRMAYLSTSRRCERSSRALVGRPSRSSLIPSASDQESGPAWSANSRTVAGW